MILGYIYIYDIRLYIYRLTIDHTSYIVDYEITIYRRPAYLKKCGANFSGLSRRVDAKTQGAIAEA